MCWCRPHMRMPQCDRVECVPGTRPMTMHEASLLASQDAAPDVAHETRPALRPALLRLELAATTWSQITKYAGLLELTAEEFCRRAVEARVRTCRDVEHEMLRDRFREVLDA